ncbi:hypothetical protein C8R46DRAFT_1040466 [Mycena filopes]|nr:hypothetical protein C8R46DRAFT_1040466 [Mycena filopes]
MTKSDQGRILRVLQSDANRRLELIWTAWGIVCTYLMPGADLEVAKMERRKRNAFCSYYGLKEYRGTKYKDTRVQAAIDVARKIGEESTSRSNIKAAQWDEAVGDRDFPVAEWKQSPGAVILDASRILRKYVAGEGIGAELIRALVNAKTIADCYKSRAVKHAYEILEMIDDIASVRREVEAAWEVRFPDYLKTAEEVKMEAVMILVSSLQTKKTEESTQEQAVRFLNKNAVIYHYDNATVRFACKVVKLVIHVMHSVRGYVVALLVEAVIVGSFDASAKGFSVRREFILAATEDLLKLNPVGCWVSNGFKAQAFLNAMDEESRSRPTIWQDEWRTITGERMKFPIKTAEEIIAECAERQ